MNLDDHTILKIEQFILEEMNAQEKLAFEFEINSSDEIKEYIQIYHQIDIFQSEDWVTIDGNNSSLKETEKLFSNKETKEFSAKLKSFKESDHRSKSNIIFRKRILYIASLAASFLVILYFVNFQNSSIDNIYDKYNSWSELPSFVVKGNTDDELKAIESLFGMKNYEEVIKNCNRSRYIDNPSLSLYLGIAYLELNQYEEALYVFKKLTMSNAIDHHKGYWYSALVYLKQERKEQAISTLNIIVDKSFYKNTEAKAILKQLK